MYSSRQRIDRNASDPYKVLGVNRNIEASELRSKWKQAVRRCHPDRGGTNLAMAQVADAYEILMKPNLRKIYDRFGRRGLEALKARKRRDFRKQSVRSRPHHPKARQKDRERSRSPKPKRQTKNPIRAILPITLSDAYKGRTKCLSVRYEEECTTCCTDEQVCPFCYGHGKYVGVGEDMLQQTWKDCEHCKGTGVRKTYSTSCHLCHGKGEYRKKQKLDVVIEPGVRNQDTIAVEINGLNAAVTFRIKKHRTFRRVGNDLFLTKKITLRESLFGNRSFEVKTLDKRTLALNFPKFQSIKPVQSYCIRNEGMPIYREPNRRGQLYIKFFVEFKIQPEDVKVFERLTELMTIPSGLGLKNNSSKSKPADNSNECGGTLPYVPVKSELISLGDKEKEEIVSSTHHEPLLISSHKFSQIRTPKVGPFF